MRSSLDVAKGVVANVWTTVSQKHFFGGAVPVPNGLDANKGSFVSFIKGVLGDDLQLAPHGSQRVDRRDPHTRFVSMRVGH